MKKLYLSGTKGPCISQDATVGVKFSSCTRILDDWYLFGGTKWSRSLFRLLHPIVYSKRGLRNLYRRIKSKIFGDAMTDETEIKEEAFKRTRISYDIILLILRPQVLYYLWILQKL